MAKQQLFDFSLLASNQLTDPKTGDKIYYLNLCECDRWNNVSRRAGSKIEIKRKGTETTEKLLVYFKLGFIADKYRNNEQGTINQWKHLHPTISDESNEKPYQLYFVNFWSGNSTSATNLANSSTASNCGVFLWDPEKTKQSNASDQYAHLRNVENFNFSMTCYSTQFPIKVENNNYIGSLFELLIEIYSVESKQKLDSASFKLKVSQNFDSQYKADLEAQKKLTESKVETSKDVIEQNLDDLLSSLSIQTLPPVNPLPSFEQLNQIKLDQTYFTYEIPNVCYNQYVLPVVYIRFNRNNRGRKSNSSIQINGSNFKPGNEGELVKTMFTFGFNKEFTSNEWLQNWERMNGDKKLLQFFVNHGSDYSSNDDITLFDIYSSAVNQFCLIWKPSKASEYFSIYFNVCDETEIDYHKLESYLMVESFRYEDNTKIDEAICRIEFASDYPTNGLTQHRSCIMKNEAKYLVKKVLFITVDGSDYVPLSFQQCFVEQFNADQFKARLVALIRRIKNMDSFQIGTLRHFKFGQKDGQGVNFNGTIFNSLEPKAALKCVLRKVRNEGSGDQQLVKYDIDLINQQ